jgi:predicted Zn-dependent protease
MSSERHRTMVEAVQAKYTAARRYPLGREAYLDRTAALRARRTTIEELQKGEEALAAGKLSAAQPHVAAALKAAPDDYAALVTMAKTQLAAKQPAEARRYAEAAQAVYPREAQACHVTGMAALAQRDFGAALQAFQRYEERLPGNPNTVFFKGYSFEGLDRRQEAAPCYDRYLRSGAEGDYAKHAYAKLVEWGYVKK